MNSLCKKAATIVLRGMLLPMAVASDDFGKNANLFNLQAHSAINAVRLHPISG